jgi:hypothetical protein
MIWQVVLKRAQSPIQEKRLYSAELIAGLDRDLAAAWWIEDYETYLDFPHAEGRGCLYNTHTI